MSGRSQGRPTKSMEEQKLTRKIADRKRYLARKNQALYSESEPHIGSEEQKIVDIDAQTDFTSNSIQETLSTQVIPDTFSRQHNYPYWRSKSSTISSEAEETSTRKEQSIEFLNKRNYQDPIHASRISHWPKVLGLEQMMDNMNIHQGERGIQEVSSNKDPELTTSEDSEQEESSLKLIDIKGKGKEEVEKSISFGFAKENQSSWRKNRYNKKDCSDSEWEIEETNYIIPEENSDAELEELLPGQEDNFISIVSSSSQTVAPENLVEKRSLHPERSQSPASLIANKNGIFRALE
ncbi:hypothetical protein B9Z19DRAFT_1127634 [Tuber borchii]|uniref:Uncharacterized protein n=1 Tax=Tuber borchii TaxID=42251 RepID=A0A2T6ZQV6_TUBBO|nr:hypothetical protein B9Z19DRAFT_1127634 [Tuber borchii]